MHFARARTRLASDARDASLLQWHYGLPKGVMLSHYNLVANVYQTLDSGRGRRDQRKTMSCCAFFRCITFTG